MSATIEQSDEMILPIDTFVDSLYRLSLDQYHAMVESGVFTENDDFELLGGMLVRKMTKNRRHVLAFTHLWKRLISIIPTGFDLQLQDPITTSDSEPEPDLVIIDGSIDDYSKQHPSSANCRLVIEVSETSLALDQGAKKTIYATGQIPEYWIVNLIDQQIEVYSEPANSDYKKQVVYSLTQSVPLMIKDQHLCDIPVADVIPKT